MPKHKPVSLTLDNLNAIAVELRRSSASIVFWVDALQEDGISQLEVTNHDQLTRALEYIQNFTAAIRTAHIAARKTAGEYGENGPSKEKPKRKPKGDK